MLIRKAVITDVKAVPVLVGDRATLGAFQCKLFSIWIDYEFFLKQSMTRTSCSCALCFSSVNGITEEADPTVYSGKVIRPLRSVDPTQTEYQGMIEVMEDGKICCF